VRIFAVPTQASITAAESLRAFPAALAEADSGRFRLWLPPVLQLEPTVPVLTLALDWCASSPHLLAAGRGDGTLAVWDLTQSVKSAPVRTGAPSTAATGGGARGNGGCGDWNGGSCGGSESGGDHGLGEAGVRHMAPLALSSLPRATLGSSTQLGGEISSLYQRGTTASSVALGHAGPVRGVRWAPDASELLASVGDDGILFVWDCDGMVPQRQRHVVAQYAQALDLAWSPRAAAIFVATDNAALRLQALREDMVLPLIAPNCDKRGGRATNRHNHSAPNKVERSARLGCAETASVWALALSNSGDRLAAVSSDGRLEIFKESSVHISKRCVRRHVEGTGVAQLHVADPHAMLGRSVGSRSAGATMGADDDPPALHIALGPAARALGLPDAPTPLAPPRAALRCASWSTHMRHGEWLACGGTSGLLLVLSDQ
jgi:WD40 repeat protein